MKLRKFDQADRDIFAGAVNPEGIVEFENEVTGHSYVIVVDSYGLTIDRFDYDGGSDFVTIEMLPSQALLLVQMMEVDFEALDALVNDAQPGIYKEVE
jgi:hypothetical protein